MSSPKNSRIQFDCRVDIDIDLRRLKKLVRAVCAELNIPAVNVQISIVGDAEITHVHRQFLGRDNTTDVISFDLSDEFEPGRNFQIIVNAEMATRQAEKRGHSAEAELALYMTHGMLHQLGYDDRDPQQAHRMHEKEDTILQTNGFGVIYHKQQMKKKRRQLRG